MRGASAATRYSNKLQSMSEGLGIELLLLVPHLMIEKILFSYGIDNGIDVIRTCKMNIVKLALKRVSEGTC